MIHAQYDYLEVDLVDIWKFERALYDNGQSSSIFLRDLSEEIRLIVNETDKSLSEEFNKDDHYIYATEIKTLTNIFFADWFCHCTKEYFPDNGSPHFQHMFALKLSQYSEQLIKIPDFLNAQLKNSFNGNIKRFLIFLKFNHRQYKKYRYFTSGIRQTVEEWAKLRIRKISGSKLKRKTIKENKGAVSIKVKPDYIIGLSDALKGYLSSNDLEKLKNTISGAEVRGKLLFLGQSNQLTYFFKMLIDNSVVISNRTEVGRWICNYFCYRNGDLVKEFSPENTYKGLIKSAKPIPKEKRIPIHFID